MTKVTLITEYLGEELIPKIEKADSVCVLTSFVMKSGVQLLSEALWKAVERGAEVKVCTGDYLYITQPDALKMLYEIHEKMEIRLFRSGGKSFHPKAYLLKEKNANTLFVGSSNLSGSAFTTGIEWNISISENHEVYEQALNEFSKLFQHEQTIPINKESIHTYEKEYREYHQRNPNIIHTWTSAEEIDLMLPVRKKNSEFVVENKEHYGTIEPRFAQVEALNQLEQTIEEGYNKAMVVMATGLGKTYLAAFFARKFKRVLFIAHREEILHQAQASFNKVIPDKTSGIYNGFLKEDGDFIFASVFTLSMKQHLQHFKRDEFDLIVIDEFHHAASQSYQKMIDYFQPEFLLGITATPDRNDQKDVYAICDGNIAYRIDFIEAVQRGWLAPFHYYGVYDDTDYSQIRWLGSKYDQEQLLQAQLKEEMAQKILLAWEEHKQTRSLIFCSSIRQANFLSQFFNRSGYQTVSLHSKQQDIGRKEAINQLEEKKLDAIFTVDLFNEGIDIPSVDTILFARPTESLTVFTQQIGRGLRLHSSKSHCVIIDLIGNYRNADIKLSLFQVELKKTKNRKIAPVIPESCEFNLDIQSINLLEELRKKRQPRKEKLKNAYMQLKEELGRRPTYQELFLNGTIEVIQYYKEFKSYFAFLHWAEELTEKEIELYIRYENWLKEIEKTGMQKSYKMIVLLGMLKKGKHNWYRSTTPEEIAPFFHHYLMEKEYRKRIDFSDKSSRTLWKYEEKKVANLIAKMPMSKWSGSSQGMISFEKNIFKLNFDVLNEDEDILFHWTREVCEKRLMEYFARKGE
ncbi:superfamily II DNA or RNA helicase/HKD family nuclease [Oikeobacillus pervagus]|uniref:Superfamily II DNA or RNA helicase/HKD family nuclease n=1 Tax=Oikeobacillus pervagus TaxID=1325931 RepID=A0AAJ1T2T1_9BACI|nr:DEAD/DEAH box helicase family protein [Oikeobacillus pervagus]MDQ0216132.1 superfamily II DNA or RNA helicase/HKD family nuclease [Oikeobacillus pervagus]